MGRSQRSKKGRYLRTQRRELLAEESDKRDSGKREVMAKILAAASPAEVRRAGMVNDDAAEPATGTTSTAGDEAGADDAMDVDDDDEGVERKGRRRRDARLKAKTAYGDVGKKQWFEMFPAVTKRKRNSVKKKKGAVRG